MFLANLRYGFRILLRNPAFGIAALTVIALGIGATTAVFTVVRAVLLQPLPYQDPDRLVVIRADGPGFTRAPALTAEEFFALRARTDIFEGVATVNQSEGNLTRSDDMEAVSAASVSDNFLSMLGVAPVLGRQVSAREDIGGEGFVRGVNLSYELWQRRWSGDPGLVGRHIEINNRDMVVIGIMPRALCVYLGSGTNLAPQIDIWFPGAPDVGRARAVPAIARLRNGISIASAQAAVDAFMTEFAGAHRASYPNGAMRLSLIGLDEDVERDVKPALLALSGAVAFVLLVACANLANLLLARATARTRELAVRAAIGASRGQLVIQLAVEGAALASLGVVGGLLVAQWAIDGLMWLAPASLPRRDLIAVDAPIALFAVALTFGCAMIVGLFSAWYATRSNMSGMMRGDSAATPVARSTRGALVSSQLALSLVLLAGAALLGRAFINLRAVRLGFDETRALTMTVQLPSARFDTPAKRLAFFTAAAEAARAVPGVRGAGVGTPLPLAGVHNVQRVSAGADDPLLTASMLIALPGYLEALRVPLRAGRSFTASDNQRNDSTVIPVIIDEQLAASLWGPGRVDEVVGRRVLLGAPPAVRQTAEVIGVAVQIQLRDLRTGPSPQIWLPYTARAFTGMTVVARTDRDPSAVAAAVERAIEQLGPGRPVSNVRPLAAYVAAASADARFAVFVVGMFAALALVLTTVGVYGVAAYATERRRREIAVRLALGADGRRIVSLIVREGLAWTICGVAVGLGAALGLTRYLEAMLFQVNPMDAATLAGVAVMLATTAIAATALPAVRAIRIDPMLALRSE
jgi:predicted permease